MLWDEIEDGMCPSQVKNIVNPNDTVAILAQDHKNHILCKWVFGAHLEVRRSGGQTAGTLVC